MINKVKGRQLCRKICTKPEFLLSKQLYKINNCQLFFLTYCLLLNRLFNFSSFFFFQNMLLTSVRRPLSVRLSHVEIIYFCGNSLSNRLIDLKFDLNVR